MTAHPSGEPMSHGTTVKTAGARVVQAGVLILLFGVLSFTTRAVPEIHEGVGTIAAVGFLLLAGTLMSELVETLRVPHLTGYLLAGIIAGPHVLHLIDHHSVVNLTQVNALALALIALEGGAELKLATVKRRLEEPHVGNLLQSSLVLTGVAGVFSFSRPLIPFLEPLGVVAVVGVRSSVGVLSVTRSPSAALGILAQNPGHRGPSRSSRSHS